MKLVLPTEQKLTMSSLRQFAEQKARYTYDENREILTNNETQERYKANDEIGFFQK
ncbi:maltose transporter membrane protein [Actinobacillus equuli]|nr:maltose transporter membrane protein [Actinobacillus equuli]